MTKKKTNKEWWVEKLKFLTDNAKHFNDGKPKDNQKIGNWTPIKQIILGYFIPFHTGIITSENNYFDTCIYVDLFAGSGINELSFEENSTKFDITGSALVSVFSSDGKYDEMIFCEGDEHYNQALKERLDSLTKNSKLKNKLKQFTVLDPMDVNLAVPEVIRRIINKKNAHSLIFVDPYGMQLNFESFEKLFNETKSDIIFYFNSNAYMRQVNAAKKGYGVEKANNFFGTNNWKNINTPDELFTMYLENIEQYRSEIKFFKIMKNKNVEAYRLVVCTKKTKSGNPWLHKFEKEIKKRLENESGETIKMTYLVEIFKLQTSLNAFL